jgi:RNA polymerase sigma factor (sigma-70 family)
VIDPSVSDQALVRRARAGDVGAYEELVRRYQDVAFRTAYLLAGGAAEAEDAAQDGFMKAYAALPRFIDGAPFRPWVLKIVANEARNRRRAAGRRVALEQRAQGATEAGVGTLSGSAPSAESHVLAQEEGIALRAAVESLAEPDRLVITARYFLELSEAEAAELLDVPRGTVKSRLSRALQRLRDAYATDSGDRVHD